MTWFSSDFDGLDLDDGKLLAVALLALVALALLLLEYDHLSPALVLQDLSGNRGARQRGPANPEISALTGRQHVLNLDDGAGYGVREAVHDEDIALRDGELLPLGFDRGFHEIKPLTKRFGESQSKA